MRFRGSRDASRIQERFLRERRSETVRPVLLSGSAVHAMMLGPPARTDWVIEGLSNHATHLLALLCRHEDWIETFGHDYGICEGVNRLRRVGDNPLPVVRGQAVAELHAEIIQQSGRVHGKTVTPERLPTSVAARPLPVDREQCRLDWPKRI